MATDKLAANYLTCFNNKQVMITGGLGFIGSNLARRLVELGARVLLVDSLIPDYGGNLFNIHDLKDRVQVNIADIRDEYGLRYLVRDQNYIFNLAGQVSHLDSMTDPFTDLEINVRAQLSLLEACRHHNPTVKIVFASTRQIYGRPDYLPLDEQHLLHPPDVNGVNKMAGEWYHTVYHRVYGLHTVSLRLTNTYGPGQLMKHNRQGFIGWFIRLAVLGQEIQIFGDGEQRRDLNFVEDVVEALLRAAASPQSQGQVYNLGCNQPITLKALAELLIEIAGQGSYRLIPFPPERKRIDVGDVYCAYARIQAQLGWQPTTPLRAGLARTIAYYRQYGEHYWS
ncbi:MAG: NAD-dependent epimerase/dehydratase family protein [Anaerolineae bacterium]|nr:NAD-dependent epimerase/dehydratase family protein [Anaerolineae bacterium]